MAESENCHFPPFFHSFNIHSTISNMSKRYVSSCLRLSYLKHCFILAVKRIELKVFLISDSNDLSG